MKALCCAAAATTCALLSHPASAEVSLGEANGWEAFTSGRVNAFLTYTAGDGFPVPPLDPATGMPSNRTYLAGGGLPTNRDRIPKVDAMDMPIATEAGTLAKWRVRSGYLPNILGFGVRNQVSSDLKLKGFVALWGTIESIGSRKYFPVQTDFHEAYFNVEGSWGSVTAGRALSLFSRGITEIELMYGHRYGVGFHPQVGDVGPTGGLIGFGVLAAAYNPGIYYTTPSMGGLAVNIGIYDAVKFSQSWDRTETPRPEGEITYDFAQGDLKVHVFANGAFQKLYKENDAKNDETLYGVGGGFRLEVGPFHLGGGGHYGRGLGMFYAFDDTAGATSPSGYATQVGPNQDPATMLPAKSNELRTFQGFAGFAQYSAEKFDINLGVGQSGAKQLEIDKALPASLIKTQTGISAGFVYHVAKNLHVDADYMRAMFSWYKGDKQAVNFINAGATIDW